MHCRAWWFGTVNFPTVCPTFMTIELEHGSVASFPLFTDASVTTRAQSIFQINSTENIETVDEDSSARIHTKLCYFHRVDLLTFDYHWFIGDHNNLRLNCWILRIWTICFHDRLLYRSDNKIIDLFIVGSKGVTRCSILKLLNF